MTEIVQFPAVTSERAVMEGDTDEIHAEVFRDLEGHIGNCATMAEITSQLMANACYPADVRAGGFFVWLSTGANRWENVAALASRAAASEDEIKV